MCCVGYKISVNVFVCPIVLRHHPTSSIVRDSGVNDYSTFHSLHDCRVAIEMSEFKSSSQNIVDDCFGGYIWGMGYAKRDVVQ